MLIPNCFHYHYLGPDTPQVNCVMLGPFPFVDVIVNQNGTHISINVDLDPDSEELVTLSWFTRKFYAEAVEKAKEWIRLFEQ